MAVLKYRDDAGVWHPAKAYINRLAGEITTAAELPISDAGAYYPTDNVEAALQVLGATPLAILEKGGYGVVSGLGVTAQGTPNMTVAVASGVLYKSDGTRQAPAANAALAVTAADATNPRIDIVYVSSAGVVSYLAGTPGATPAAPSVSSGGLLLARISVAAGITAVTSAMIALRRKFLRIEDWIKPDLTNGWVEYDSNSPIGYFKDSTGIVHFRGSLSVGAANTVAFTMPSGYRPNKTQRPILRGNGTPIYAYIEAGGAFVPSTAAYTVFVSLDGYTYLAER